MENKKILNLLSKSERSSVYKAFDSQLKFQVVIKKIPKKNESSLEDFAREQLASSKILSSEFILTHYEFHQDKHFYYIVSDIYDYSISKMISSPTFTQSVLLTKRIVFHLLQAIDNLSKAGYCHLNISPKTVIFHNNRFKLMNFKYIEPIGELLQKRYDSFSFAAPEVILGIGKATAMTDVFSVGTLMILLLTGESIFDGVKKDLVLTKMVNTLGDPSKAGWPEGAKKLRTRIEYESKSSSKIKFVLNEVCPSSCFIAEQMMQWNPLKRQSAAVLLQNSFFDEVRKEEKQKRVRKINSVGHKKFMPIACMNDLTSLLPKVSFNPSTNYNLLYTDQLKTKKLKTTVELPLIAMIGKNETKNERAETEPDDDRVRRVSRRLTEGIKKKLSLNFGEEDMHMEVMKMKAMKSTKNIEKINKFYKMM